MKRLRILALFLIITSSIVLPISARPSGFSAQGSIDTYLDELPHAEVVDGHWSVNVKEVHGEYKISFNAFYRELNLGGEGAHPYDQAVGLIDHFWLNLDDPSVVEMGEDYCVVLWKDWWQLGRSALRRFSGRRRDCILRTGLFEQL